jgi:hypothetical protein
MTSAQFPMFTAAQWLGAAIEVADQGPCSKARSFACRPEKAAQKQKKNPGGYTAGIFRFLNLDQSIAVMDRSCTGYA